jgi:hypothetical protein
MGPTLADFQVEVPGSVCVLALGHRALVHNLRKLGERSIIFAEAL